MSDKKPDDGSGIDAVRALRDIAQEMQQQPNADGDKKGKSRRNRGTGSDGICDSFLKTHLRAAGAFLREAPGRADGGEGGIRTHGRRKPTTVFETEFGPISQPLVHKFFSKTLTISATCVLIESLTTKSSFYRSRVHFSHFFP